MLSWGPWGYNAVILLFSHFFLHFFIIFVGDLMNYSCALPYMIFLLFLHFIIYSCFCEFKFILQVTLDKGIPWNSINETCTSGAGTLVLEFGVLSRLLNDPVYESVSRQAVNKLWRLRSNVTGLLGISV